MGPGTSLPGPRPALPLQWVVVDQHPQQLLVFAHQESRETEEGRQASGLTRCSGQRSSPVCRRK